MALRLTRNTLAASEPANDILNSPSALSAAARAALIAGDPARFRELAQQVAGETDDNRRYYLRTKLVDGAFEAARSASNAIAKQAFVAAAELTVAVLEDEPREPVLLNLAGVALYELWALDAAHALFRAAVKLDPSLPHVRENLSALGLRRQERTSRRPMHPALPAIARRARKIAATAAPASNQKLSLCMIVRDEEEMLPRSLAAAAPAVDEIIVVDTGSRDATVEIARSFGAKIIEHTWTGSFAEARNVSFDAATGDWIIYLDADEVLVSEDVARLRQLTGRTWREAFYFTETNFTGDAGDGTAVTHNALRMFRNRPQYRFEGRLHEQIAQHLPAYAPERIEHTTVRIEHYGYLGAVRDAKEKSRRNIELLLKQRAEAPDSPFLRFNLGSEYAAAGDAEAALTEFERSWQMLRDGELWREHEFSPTLMVRLVKCLRAVGRAEEALSQAEEGLLCFPGFTDIVFEQALASYAVGRPQDAIDFYERCIDLGDAPARYTAMRGCGTYLPRLALAEIYTFGGELERARELLDWCVGNFPEFFGNVLPYATVLLRSGWSPGDVVAEIEARVGKPSPTVRFMLGTALYEAGATEDAEHQYKEILAHYPERVPVQIALGETLLAQKRYDEAARLAATIDPESPLATIAVRSELFGLLAAGLTDRVPETLTRAHAAGLPTAELELFAAWAEARAEEATHRYLTPAAAGLLEVMLEALLRVQDFVAFEGLVDLFSRCGLPERERRERLAAMYLRRGYLASAAEEWIAVCQQLPDARALVGLAKVARGQGLPEDTAAFAAEALNLDPDCREAAALLQRLAGTPVAVS